MAAAPVTAEVPAMPDENCGSNSDIKQPPFSTDDCPILALNTDCLLKIFGYLPIVDIVSIDKVCLLWRHTLDTYWRTYTSMDCTDFHYSTVRAYMLKRCGPWLKKIDFPPLYDDDPTTTSFLNNLLKNCPKIEHMVLNILLLKPKTTRLLYRLLKQLKCIEIDDRSVDRKFLEGIFKHTRRLKVLLFNSKEVKHCFTLTAAFQFLPKTITKINVGFVEHIDAKFLITLRNRCPDLEVLQLRANVDGKDLSCEITKFTKLKELTLVNPSLTIAASKQLLTLSQLVKLELRHTEEINDEYLGKIAESLPHLCHLDIQSQMNMNLTDKGIKKLAKLKLLEHLNLSYLNLISCKGIVPIAANGKLKELILISTNVADDVVSKVVVPCCYLKILDLSSCQAITLKIHSLLSEVFLLGNNRAQLKVITGGSGYVLSQKLDDKDHIPAKVTYPNLLIDTELNNVNIRLHRGQVLLEYSDDDYSDFDDDYYDDDDDDDYDDYYDDDDDYGVFDAEYSGYCFDDGEWFEYDDSFIFTG